MRLERGNAKVMVAMSGGVDSSVAALLLKRGGYDCAGAMLKLFDGAPSDDGGRQSCNGGQSCGGRQSSGLPASRACCSLDDAEDARKVAYRLGMPFYALNFKSIFQKEVIGRFVAAYESGATPNPCIDCNRFVKFGWLLRKAEAMGFTHIATGHYARIEYGGAGGRHLLKKGADETKDQSYVLYALTQRQLERLILPLGGLRKERARELARRCGFANAGKRDSQDICFVPDGDYAGFIEAYTGRAAERGPFLDLQGNAVGTHRGAVRYTLGQRRGLGLAMPSPVYVCAKSMRDNTVTVGGESSLYSKSLTARDINFIPFDAAPAPMRVKARTRYRQPEQWATLEQTGDDEAHVEFDAPQRAITPGQAVVLYDGDLVIGGGTIV